MCGICGFVDNKDPGLKVLRKMNDQLSHRGPDDTGEMIFSANGLWYGLGQRRLSIIDLSNNGHQPMSSVDGNITIVYNGEIYNYVELREELLEYGYKFKSNTDTEVVIYAYKHWGLDCLNIFNGMFAFALFDRNLGCLILARDRMGQKPLYYYKGANTFLFASELKSIMEYPDFTKNIQISIISRYLYHQYISSPDTIFEKTYKLEPGCYLIFKNNEYIVNKYWDPLSKYFEKSNELISNYRTAKKQLHDLLKDSIAKRMISDVPLGTFLSGGIDSSLITAIAQSNSSSPINTYTIGFYEKIFDESSYAAEIAKVLGTNHSTYMVQESDLLSLVESIPVYYDEPFADASQISTMLVSKLAKQDVSVAISGDGGDELFCGYNIYDNLRIVQRVDWLGNLFYYILKIGGKNRNFLLSKMPGKLKALILNRDFRTKTQLHYYVHPDKATSLVNKCVQPVQYVVEDNFNISNWQMRRMLLDIITYLPDDILAKVDRASMKYSLEARCPLLDHRVVELSFQIPHKFKYLHNDKKHILKDITYEYIPKDLLNRPKQGFAVPIAKWLRFDLNKQLNLFSKKDVINKQGIFDYNVLKEVLINLNTSSPYYDRLIWSFFVFQKWYNKYIEDIGG